MDSAFLQFLARSFGGAITSAARPALTFLVVQLFAAALVRLDYATLPPSFAWLVSIPAIAVAALLAVLELMAQHDEIGSVLRDLHVEPLLGAFGAFSVGLLFAALGLPEADAQALLPTQAADLARATHSAVASDASEGMKLAVIGASVALNLGLSWLRGQVMDWLAQLALDESWARLESGGVLAALVLMVFFPVIALVLLVLIAAALGALGLVIHGAQRLIDRLERAPCPGCGAAVRPEASLCASCRRELEPRVLLGQESPALARLRLALGRLRRREPLAAG